ncbi:hypothetical protein [Desulforhabdus amnigena]|nr:hypothetical protein [Desulforhabdus amnigena]NLJ26919.1 hypothetical protein [Deltaproteobacteria bacterium]
MMRKEEARHKGAGRKDKPVSKSSEGVREASTKVLEIVLKCDSYGSTEAVSSALGKIQYPQVEIRIINAGVGTITKSDLLMALTGSKLVLGFNTGIMPRLEGWIKDNGVEVRLYGVIYKLIEDVDRIVQSLISPGPVEKIMGKARVIALFKGGRRGIILGCEIIEGTLSVGSAFRLITAMGPVYTGKIESLQIEKKAIKEGKRGQQVGLKISNFDEAKIGDLVETYQLVDSRDIHAWSPRGRILTV